MTIRTNRHWITVTARVILAVMLGFAVGAVFVAAFMYHPVHTLSVVVAVLLVVAAAGAFEKEVDDND